MSSDLSVNRELSWLELNRRFLRDARDSSLPLLERVKRLATFSANLDKFFMVRVAELKRRARADGRVADSVASAAAETLAAVVARIHDLVDEQNRCFLDEIQPLLASEGVLLLRPKEAAPDQQRFLGTYFRQSLLPVLTPLAIDSGKPFPYLGNCSLSLAVSIRPSKSSVLPHATLSVIHIPRRVLPSFVALPAPGRDPPVPAVDLLRLRHRVEPRHSHDA
jgi:polyphosphate kinase